jgi:hypothetical protein
MINGYDVIDGLWRLEKKLGNVSDGRECYAFTTIEDLSIDKLKVEAQGLFLMYGILNKDDYKIENDALGNLFITFYGQDRSKSVVCGSHIDSVFRGGKYDGLAGVSSAFSFLEKLLKEGKKPDKNYMIAVFRAEESSPKTGVACLGSMVATGLMSREKLEKVMYRVDNESSITLKEYFISKYGEEKWMEVLEELDNPPLTKENVVNYEELHIEQSAVCEKNNVDVGIVVDGIGGAVREKVNHVLHELMVEEVECSNENPMIRYKIAVFGEAAHTGGTPPNPKLKKKYNGGCWYRNDALISSIHLAKLVMKVGGEKARFAGLYIEKETGFTTVPFEQMLEFAVMKDHEADFDKVLLECGSRMSENFGTVMVSKKEQVDNGKVKVFNNAVSKVLDVPLFVERVVRNEVIKQNGGNGGVGKVRGTVTDFQLDRDYASYNLDFRDVDSVAIKDLINVVHTKIESICPFTKVDKIAAKECEPVDEKAVEIKRKIAEDLGLSYVLMPSLPGHDAGCLAAIGVPVSMTFIRHDGLSHNASEKVDPAKFQKAQTLSHEYLRTLLFSE